MGRGGCGRRCCCSGSWPCCCPSRPRRACRRDRARVAGSLHDARAGGLPVLAAVGATAGRARASRPTVVAVLGGGALLALAHLVGFAAALRRYTVGVGDPRPFWAFLAVDGWAPPGDTGCCWCWPGVVIAARGWGTGRGHRPGPARRPRGRRSRSLPAIAPPTHRLAHPRIVMATAPVDHPDVSVILPVYNEVGTCRPRSTGSAPGSTPASSPTRSSSSTTAPPTGRPSSPVASTGCGWRSSRATGGPAPSGASARSWRAATWSCGPTST